MKKSVISALLLSALGTSTSFATLDLPSVQNLTPQEMSSVVGEGIPYFRTTAGSTWISLVAIGVGAGQAYVAPGNWTWGVLANGTRVVMQCQQQGGAWTYRQAGPFALYGNFTLNCF